MRVVDSLRLARAPRSLDTGSLVELLRADPAAGLAQLARFAETLDAQQPSADARLAVLEPLRGAWRPAIAATLQPLRNRPLPYDADELAAWHRTTRALRAMRDALKRIHADLREPAADTPPAPRALLALARALDVQSRLLTAALRCRLGMPRDDWDELCRLAHPLWTASALDESFPEAGPATPSRPTTPRAAFALPLLLRLLEPLGLAAPAFELARAIAEGAARRTGIVIDVDGLPKVSRDGPALMVSSHHTVRLDTRLTHSWIQRCRERIGQGASPASLGLRTTLSVADVALLLERLEAVWAPGYVPTPLVRPPLAQALLHVGLPQRVRAADAPSIDAADAGARPGERAVYVYGRAQLAGDPGGGMPPADVDPAAREAAARAMMATLGVPVAWRGQDARRSVFTRDDATPRLRLGQLVAVMPVRSTEVGRRPGVPRPGSGPSRPLVGRVATLSHTGAVGAREPFAHDIGIVFWPGAPLPVRIKLDGASAFEDAWWFPGDGDDAAPQSLVMRRDRFETATDVVVREPSGDRELRIRRLLERGVDFDRVEVSSIG